MILSDEEDINKQTKYFRKANLQIHISVSPIVKFKQGIS